MLANTKPGLFPSGAGVTPPRDSGFTPKIYPSHLQVRATIHKVDRLAELAVHTWGTGGVQAEAFLDAWSR